ncbi:helix-turn-helix domain-containing protein [Thermogutta sp.]|jgi:hypothetical protein|uniref:helix-turn-helix domain-containing protein n=1 Tax=Thermogutta sp. TaxID=1962930 RepID=UPI00321F8F35
MLQKLVLSPREAAYQLGISLRHLWNLSQPRGPLPVVKLGRRIFYRPEDLAEFIRQAAEASRPAAETTRGLAND